MSETRGDRPRLTKAQLRARLSAGILPAVAEAARHQPRTLSLLTALTYDLEPSIAERAIEALGEVAALVAAEHPERVRVHLRRLFWLLNDESGGIGWRAPEAIGAILRACPRQFPEFEPLLLAVLDMEPEDAVRFRAGALRAIGRLAAVIADRPDALPAVRACLDDPDPSIRQLAVWCAGQIELHVGHPSSENAPH